MASSKTHRLAWRVIALGITTAILVACWMPGKHMPNTGGHNADKVLHALSFVALAFAWRRAGVGAIAVLGICLAVAGATEGGQRLMGAGRTFEWWDIAADLVGAVIGVALANLARRRAVDAPSA